MTNVLEHFSQKWLEIENVVSSIRNLTTEESAKLRGVFHELEEIDKITNGNDDSMGRKLLTKVLKENPSQAALEVFLDIYPDSVCSNPIAFFTACEQKTSINTLGPMMKQLVQKMKNDECPYPWIISKYITFDGAKVLIETYPEGVLKKSKILSGYNVLDYFLLSDDIINLRTFDSTLWNKFKLMILAAQYCTGDLVMTPIQSFLRNVLLHDELFTNPIKAHHMLWLLRQLQHTDHWVFKKQCKDGKYPLHFLINQMCTIPDSGLPVVREMIRILIEAYPDAVKHCLHGISTLHLAVANRWPCHDLLLAIYPDALNLQDPIFGLYPFQMAAMVAIPNLVKEEIMSSTSSTTHEGEEVESMATSGMEEVVEETTQDTDTEEVDDDETINTTDATESNVESTSPCRGVDVTYELLRSNPALLLTFMKRGWRLYGNRGSMPKSVCVSKK